MSYLSRAQSHHLVHTDQYQSMYRVLNVFALMNAVLGEDLRFLFFDLSCDTNISHFCVFDITFPCCPTTQEGRRAHVAWSRHILRLVQ